jgi:hypothetical protein
MVHLSGRKYLKIIVNKLTDKESMKKFLLLFTGLTFFTMPQTNFPKAEITNKLISATIYLPDNTNGYYRGTRFDRSGNIPSLKYRGHEYFGQWFPMYSPEIHDAIMGPVEEFTALDYLETKPGDSFVKIGVGVLSKPDDQAYTFSRLYPVLNPGKWSVKTDYDVIKFTHELNDKVYSYLYEKTIQLTPGKAEMVISHKLKNTGTKTIETSAYDHNFFVMDNQPVGPGYTITVPFQMTGEGRGIGDLAEIDGNKIVFLKNLTGSETVFCSGLEGFGPSASDYDIRIENKISGTGVRIRCDQPLLKLVFWSCATTPCPEPYIKIKAEPGKEFSWKITYEFYTMPLKAE